MKKEMHYTVQRSTQRPVVSIKSGRHRVQSITLIENAEAVIIQKLRWIPEH